MENEVKYCDACKEDFAPKYSFCPICGAQLSTAGDLPILNPPEVTLPEMMPAEAGYQITIVREKNVRQRNLLLLGAVIVMTTMAVAGTIYSIFNKPLDLAAVDTGDRFSFISDIDPVSMDPAEDLKKDKDLAGGGGGGDNDKNKTQKGREATQVQDPLFSPSKDYTQMTDPDLKIRAATEGTKPNKLTDEPYGLITGGPIPSDGEGCCNGQGPGRGTGQGPGNGRGLGPGDEEGPGGGGKDPNGGRPKDDEIIPEVKVAKVTEPIQILSKPRATYTEQARINVVQGKVILKVTFLASGGIGNIVAVTTLGSGLTEQAIAAARQIKFIPAKVNGKAVSTTKTIEYSFAIF